MTQIQEVIKRRKIVKSFSFSILDHRAPGRLYNNLSVSSNKGLKKR